ncbi:MAG: CBS domain-containing protein [Aquificota bacterium]|nr:CBS domain-containing protein [Aquificota bacterium]
MEKIIVLQKGADLDALSSALGVQKLHEDALLLTPRYLSRRAGRVFKAFRHLFRTTEDMPSEFVLVLVDTRYIPEGVERDRIKGFIVYDHHPEGEVEVFEGRVDRVGATATLVVEDLMRKDVELTPEEATLIALGIYEDTGNFTYEGTTPRDLEAVAWLLSKGLDLRTLRRFLSEGYTRDQIEAVSSILSSVEKVYLRGKEIAVATAVLERYEPDITSLLYEVKDLKEADAFFVVVEAGGKTYVFGRSQDEEIDVGKILSHFGGGGHREAGALKAENLPAQRIKDLIVSFLRSGGSIRVRVGDLMTSPPFVVEAKTRVREALELLTERGFAGAPVVDDKGGLVGVISKKTLLKVVRLFPEDPVESFTLRDVHTLGPQDPVWEAEEILARFGQTLIPVVDKGRVVGVITRFDILRKLREDLGDLKAPDEEGQDTRLSGRPCQGGGQDRGGFGLQGLPRGRCGEGHDPREGGEGRGLRS